MEEGLTRHSWDAETWNANTRNTQPRSRNPSEYLAGERVDAVIEKLNARDWKHNRRTSDHTTRNALDSEASDFIMYIHGEHLRGTLPSDQDSDEEDAFADLVNSSRRSDSRISDFEPLPTSAQASLSARSRIAISEDNNNNKSDNNDHNDGNIINEDVHSISGNDDLNETNVHPPSSAEGPGESAGETGDFASSAWVRSFAPNEVEEEQEDAVSDVAPHEYAARESQVDDTSTRAQWP
jgi:hypothetical protein